jgi:hypothetical protein
MHENLFASILMVWLKRSLKDTQYDWEQAGTAQWVYYSNGNTLRNNIISMYQWSDYEFH